MKPDTLGGYRQRLLNKQTELLESEQQTQDDTRPVELDQSSVGRLSRMDAMQRQEMAQESARRRKKRLIDIERALLRLEQGEYGYCNACDELINPRRLETDLTITLCIDCAETAGRTP
ncbi:TraR/DksA family transcriptional regulator [Nitrincola sp. MINF-07-Sa-05]|uniref:TraR/DksA family transcriptional regulator n=1 Tax=Nitrincola salilacus TaxID=3400273 RepID=UPI0039180FAD